MCRTQDADEVAVNFAKLLFAGHESTVRRLDTGVARPLSHEGQWDRLVAEPELVEAAVEEIVRAAPVGAAGGLIRYARTDIDVAGYGYARAMPSC
jgi:cytochrome P450